MSKLIEIARRKARENAESDVTEATDEFKITEKDLLLLIGMLTLVNSGQTIPSGATWTTKNGTRIPITEAKLKGILRKAIAAWINRTMTDVDNMTHAELLDFIEN